jgi:hypothetical protein
MIKIIRMFFVMPPVRQSALLPSFDYGKAQQAGALHIGVIRVIRGLPKFLPPPYRLPLLAGHPLE